MELNEWDAETPKEEISVAKLKELIASTRRLREKYEEKKKESTEAYDKYREAEQLVIAAMESTGQKKFSIPGMGTMSLVNKYQVTVPKDVNEKRKLFNFISERYGKDILDEYRSINYQSLNSFYKQEAELAEAEGRDFSIPGVEDPTVKVETRWRSEKK